MFTNNSTCIIDQKALDALCRTYDIYAITRPILQPQRSMPTIYSEEELQDQDHCMIPTISHHIWLTNPAKPREIRAEDMANLQNTISIIDGNSTVDWQHVLWTNCKACIPETIEQLSSLNIIVEDFNDAKWPFQTTDIINSLVDQNIYGIAVDLIREDIVNTMGGFYSDLNYIIHKSPEYLMKQFNFIINSPDNATVENYMFASSPNHPVLQNAIANTVTWLEHAESLLGIKITNDLTNEISYSSFVMAFAKYANQGNTTDLAIPSASYSNLIDDGQCWIASFSTDDSTYTYEEDLQEMMYYACRGEEQIIRNHDIITEIMQHIEEYQYDYGQCLSYDVQFGHDGINGGTWDIDE